MLDLTPEDLAEYAVVKAELDARLAVGDVPKDDFRLPRASASGSFFIRPGFWTAEEFRERIERAGVGRFRIASWAVCDAMAGELVGA